MGPDFEMPAAYRPVGRNEKMTNIQIRNASDRDCELIIRFLRAALQDMEAAGGHVVNSDETFWRDYSEKVIKAIKPNDHLYLLAQTANAVVGYLEGKASALHEVFAFKKYFHLNAIYVVPEARNQGIATVLVQKALRWAAEQGCREADLNVLVNNCNAKGLYKKLGFKVFRYEMRMQLPTNP
jgi:ribosomal protein S18 acetylase RimI-like enzyme